MTMLRLFGWACVVFLGYLVVIAPALPEVGLMVLLIMVLRWTARRHRHG